MSQQLTQEQLLGLAQQFGTPLYVYHAEKIKEQYEKLTTGFADVDARFFFACKALTNINILKYVDSLGCDGRAVAGRTGAGRAAGSRGRARTP